MSVTARPPRWEAHLKKHGKERLRVRPVSKVTRCKVESVCDVVGEIPDWYPLELDFTDAKEVYNWNAAFVDFDDGRLQGGAAKFRRFRLTLRLLRGWPVLSDQRLMDRMLFALPSHDLGTRGPLRVSPYLLPNLCANLPCRQSRNAVEIYRTYFFAAGRLRFGQLMRSVSEQE